MNQAPPVSWSGPAEKAFSIAKAMQGTKGWTVSVI